MAQILGIQVDDDALGRWSDWLAPEMQPFFVEDPYSWPSTGGRHEVTPALRDTFAFWNVDRGDLEVIWLDEDRFRALSRRHRGILVRSQVDCGRGEVPTVRRWCDLLDPDTLRGQADGHRFVWWSSLLEPNRLRILDRVLSARLNDSRHTEVAEATWRNCQARLPGARELAGSFAPGSGPNCFGTVMAAAGFPVAANGWTLIEPFVDWLDSSCRPGGADSEPGTVFVWRDSDNRPAHAAVALGDGWALEKPSQAWMTPRMVLTVRDIINANRTTGLHLERHHMTG